MANRTQSLNDSISAIENEIEKITSNTSIKQVDNLEQIDSGILLGIILLVYVIIVIAFASYWIKSGVSPENVLKIFGSFLVISSAIFLIVAGYSEQQISPVIGLLGTIVGYILGKTNSS